MPLSAGSRLGPYEIVSPIGAGGMGEVYKATDTRLGRTVAIKTLLNAHDERFRREARAIAALNHPHICALYDVGPDYLVMEYVEGSPLAGPLSPEEALPLALQVVAALEAAHAKGITHRDLKPANIMLSASGVKLLDFGLARLTNPEDSDTTRTVEGTVMGTAAYMSPEQAKGLTADARSDIFSFGLVLYEMLSGRRAFGNTSAIETIAAIVRDEPRPLENAPESLTAVVHRCLRKSPGERYQTMAEVRTALEQAAAKPAEKAPSVAVLPFANMSRDADDEYFSDGLAEEIINALTQVRGLKVIARTSAFAFKGKNEDIRKIAETLGVTNVLEGSVRRSGSRIRITAQLIQAADGTHLWSQRYDRDMTDVFAIQDEISAAIAGQLECRLGRRKCGTTNVAAYEAYLEGRHHSLQLNPESSAKALACFQRAATIDPGYAAPHFGMAEYYLVMATLGGAEPRQALPQAEAAARRALELDDTLADAHALLACARMTLDYAWAEGERHCRRALELNPASFSACMAQGFWYLCAQGKPEAALEVMDRALDQDPLSPASRYGRAGILMSCRRYEEAAQECRRALEIAPHYMTAQFVLAQALAMQRRFDEALALAEEIVQIHGRWSLPLVVLATVHGKAGQLEAAHRVLEELQELGRRTAVPASHIATIYALLGEKDAAFEWADRAVQQRDPFIVFVKTWEAFDPLRSDPRYDALLRKMNLT